MKQKYMKPSLVVESFSLTQSIAHNCATEFFHPDTINANHPSTCVYNPGGIKTGAAEDAVFSHGNTLCVIDDAVYELACYNNPEDALSVFAS